jgi:NAD(P)-dependent dehydrogenase (short-subunit alcohol dehydrogenase family)
MRVLVTGASSGLGRELLDVFIAKGWHGSGTSHLTGENLPDIDRGKYWPFDATTGASLVLGVKSLVQNSEPVDCLINNAGINAIRKFEDLDDYFIERIMRVNFLAAVMLTQEMLKAGKLNKGAVVVNIISDAAWRPMRHSLAYNCSKAALDMATKQMARELTKPHGISVIGIRPGKMSGTGMSKYIDEQVCELRGWTPEQAWDYFVNNTVTGKELHPKQVAALVAHLVCGGMAPAMSGACMDLVG